MSQRKGAYLEGREKDLAIAAFLEWYAARELRRCVEITSDYPLAQWARQHSARLAKERTDSMGYYRNTKPRSRGRR